MNPIKRMRPASQSQLDAYVEPWQVDHRNAMNCADCEDVIAVGIALYNLFRGRDQINREMIFRGVSGYFVEDCVVYRDGLAAWLDATRSILATQISPLERNYAVNGADQLRAQASELTEYLANWTAPTVSTAIGLRELQLDNDAGTELNRILASAKVHPTPMPSGPPMEEVSLENFRSRSQ